MGVAKQKDLYDQAAGRFVYLKKDEVNSGERGREWLPRLLQLRPQPKRHTPTRTLSWHGRRRMTRRWAPVATKKKWWSHTKKRVLISNRYNWRQSSCLISTAQNKLYTSWREKRTAALTAIPFAKKNKTGRGARERERNMGKEKEKKLMFRRERRQDF